MFSRFLIWFANFIFEAETSVTHWRIFSENGTYVGRLSIFVFQFYWKYSNYDSMSNILTIQTCKTIIPMKSTVRKNEQWTVTTHAS